MPPSHLAEIRDLEENIVGHIEQQEGRPFVHLEKNWQTIGDSINRTIRDGGSFPTPQHKLREIDSCGDADLEAVIHTIRILSERRLRIHTASVAGDEL